jgi:hypothetical protein
LEGKLDPRTSDVPLDTINTLLGNWKGNLFASENPASPPPNPYNWLLIAHRNLKAYTEKQNLRVSGILPDESLASYGAKSKNQQYITKKEQTDNPRKLPPEQCTNFNQGLPHWQLASAMFQCNVTQFFQGTNI